MDETNFENNKSDVEKNDPIFSTDRNYIELNKLLSDDNYNKLRDNLFANIQK